MKDLTNLRKIAEAATPGPWETLGGQGPFGTHAVCHRMEQGTLVEIAYRDAHFDKANAVHIATFDPPTVLDLITRLEQAEENLESALEANKHWAHRSSRERSELFKAELRAEQAVADYEATTLAVQRVRELALESQAEVAQMNMPNIRTLSGEILRALDGEQS